MKNLYEEFKLYENLWEAAEKPETEVPATEDPYAEFNLSSSVEEALAQFGEFEELEYDGFTDSWEEDAWDYDASNHTTISRSRSYGDFTYRVPTEDIWETLRDIIIDKYINKPGYIEKALQYYYKRRFGSWSQDRAEPYAQDFKKIVADYHKFQELWNTDDEAGDKLDIYIADNLDKFICLFELPLKEYYKEWARESQY